MSIANSSMTIRHDVAFNLRQAHLTKMKAGESLRTPKFDVAYSGGLQFWIEWFPAGDKREHRNHLSVCLHMNNEANYTADWFINDTPWWGLSANQSNDASCNLSLFRHFHHTILHDYFCMGFLTITAKLAFTFDVPFNASRPRLFECCDHVPSDVEIIVGEERLKVHQSYLSLISPVFNAMFSHSTLESTTKRVEIIDFDYDVVKAAIDWAYGRDLVKPSLDFVLEILRFADKYDIKVIHTQLEPIVRANLSVPDFCQIAQYAYDCSKDALLEDCAIFFRNNQNILTPMKKFEQLPLELVITMLKKGFGFQTQFEVLRHCADYTHFILSVRDYLEKSLFESLSLNNIRDAVGYACEFEREELQDRCASFVNANRDQSMMLKEINNLDSDAVGRMLKLLRVD